MAFYGIPFIGIANISGVLPNETPGITLNYMAFYGIKLHGILWHSSHWNCKYLRGLTELESRHYIELHCILWNRITWHSMAFHLLELQISQGSYLTRVPALHCIELHGILWNRITWHCFQMITIDQRITLLPRNVKISVNTYGQVFLNRRKGKNYSDRTLIKFFITLKFILKYKAQNNYYTQTGET